MYLENFKQFKTRVALQQEEAAKYCAVDVSVIQKMLQHLEPEDEDVVQVNSKAFAIDGDLAEKQLSPPTAPLLHSTAYANGNGSAKSTDEAAGSGNTHLISPKINLLNCANVRTLDPMASAADSTQLNSNVSNIQNKRHHSKEAGQKYKDYQYSLGCSKQNSKRTENAQ
ncbi:hypothetical protein KY284_028051 [Solanum tuberosum]|nr:hypothetical protein KY284_028051 [Solanum tuberosum]